MLAPHMQFFVYALKTDGEMGVKKDRKFVIYWQQFDLKVMENRFRRLFFLPERRTAHKRRLPV